MAEKKKPVKKSGQTQAQKDKVEKYKKDQAVKNAAKKSKQESGYARTFVTAKKTVEKGFKNWGVGKSNMTPAERSGASSARQEKAAANRASGPKVQPTRAVRLGGAVIGQKKLKKK